MLAAFILISALLHLAVLYFVPGFGALSAKEKEIVPIYVVVEPIEIPKPRPRPAGEAQEKPVRRPLPETLQSSSSETPPESSSEPGGASKPLILPDILVPKSATESETLLPVPDIPEKTKIPEVAGKGSRVEGELAALEAQREKKLLKEDYRKELPTAGRGTDRLSPKIYDFDIMPTNDRKVVFVPPEPDFALSNDAKVTLKFSIDKNGNTSDIIFITRSDAFVEDLAKKYVENMKFEAVIYNDKDTAQITITFKVRK